MEFFTCKSVNFECFFLNSLMSLKAAEIREQYYNFLGSNKYSKQKKKK